MKKILEDLKLDIICRDKFKMCLESYDRSKMNSVFIWTMLEYQQLAALYSCKKTFFNSPEEALSHLWLTYFFDEEWKIPISSIELFDKVYNSYLNAIKTFKPKKVDCEFVKKYIESQIRNKIEYINEQKNINSRDYPDCGIFINNKKITEDSFILENLHVINAYQLSFNPFWASYYAFFLETENEYFYFFE